MHEWVIINQVPYLHVIINGSTEAIHIKGNCRPAYCTLILHDRATTGKYLTQAGFFFFFFFFLGGGGGGVGGGIPPPPQGRL